MHVYVFRDDSARPLNKPHSAIILVRSGMRFFGSFQMIPMPIGKLRVRRTSLHRDSMELGSTVAMILARGGSQSKLGSTVRALPPVRTCSYTNSKLFFVFEFLFRLIKHLLPFPPFQETTHLGEFVCDSISPLQTEQRSPSRFLPKPTR